MKKFHEPVKKSPVARFYYKGTHSHPVRRTVLIIESKPGYLKGYELREGSTTRTFKNAPVKTYSKNRIAKSNQLKHKKGNGDTTTLQRAKLIDLVKRGA